MLIIATKADKISRGAVNKQIAQIRKSLGVKEIEYFTLFFTEKQGRAELLNVIYEMLVD